MRSVIVLVTLFVCTVVVATVWFLFRWNMAFYSLALLAVPAGIFLINHPKILFGGILAMPFSQITLPGLPNSLYVYHVFILIALVLMVLNVSLSKENRFKWGPTQFFGLLFFLNMMVIIAIRGFGLQVLGSSNWGGMLYLQALIPLSLLFLQPPVTFTVKEWRRIGVAFLICSSLPPLAEGLYFLSGGVLYHQYYFIDFNMMTGENFQAQYMGQEMVRFQSLNKLGPLLVLLSVPMILTRTYRPLWISMLGVGAILIGLSGHRSVLIDLIVLVAVGGWFYFSKTRVQYLIGALFSGVIVLLLVYQYATLLPLSFQRALMILPGIDVSSEAYMSAQGTLNWRYQIWGEALTEIRQNPDYLILGKGLTYSAREYIALTLFDYAYWWAILTSNYHQGFLSLVIITGIPGLITALGIFLCAIYRGIADERGISGPATRTALFYMHRMVLVYFALLVVKFFVIYGDLNKYLPQLYYMIFAMGMFMDTLRIQQGASENLAPAPSPVDVNPKVLPLGAPAFTTSR